LEGLAVENVGIFYVHLVYIPAICHILWPCGTFSLVLVHFCPFWYIFARFGTLYQENSGNPGLANLFRLNFRVRISCHMTQLGEPSSHVSGRNKKANFDTAKK
jgi:hypothetical protein